MILLLLTAHGAEDVCGAQLRQALDERGLGRNFEAPYTEVGKRPRPVPVARSRASLHVDRTLVLYGDREVVGFDIDDEAVRWRTPVVGTRFQNQKHMVPLAEGHVAVLGYDPAGVRVDVLETEGGSVVSSFGQPGNLVAVVGVRGELVLLTSGSRGIYEEDATRTELIPALTAQGSRTFFTLEEGRWKRSTVPCRAVHPVTPSWGYTMAGVYPVGGEPQVDSFLIDSSPNDFGVHEGVLHAHTQNYGSVQWAVRDGRVRLVSFGGPVVRGMVVGGRRLFEKTGVLAAEDGRIEKTLGKAIGDPWGSESLTYVVGNQLTTKGKRSRIPKNTERISVQGDAVVGATIGGIWVVEDGKLAEGDLIDGNGDAVYPELSPHVVALDGDWLLIGTHGQTRGAALFERTREGLGLVQSWTQPRKPNDSSGAFLIDGAAWTVAPSILVRAGADGTETFSW